MSPVRHGRLVASVPLPALALALALSAATPAQAQDSRLADSNALAWVKVLATPAAQAPSAEGGTPPPLAGRGWYRSVASYAHWGTNFSALEIAKIGNQGYAKWFYRFAPDGRYEFTHEFWSLSRSNEIWTVEESGTYRQSADTI